MSKQRNIDIHPIVRQIIDRDCHVGWSNRRVIRHVVSKLRDGQRTFRAMPREDRRTLLQQCIERHRQNWEEYVNVMGGWSSLGKVHPSFRNRGGDE
jgi:hypothetical protein